MSASPQLEQNDTQEIPRIVIRQRPYKGLLFGRQRPDADRILAGEIYYSRVHPFFLWRILVCGALAALGLVALTALAGVGFGGALVVILLTASVDLLWFAHRVAEVAEFGPERVEFKEGLVRVKTAGVDYRNTTDQDTTSAIIGFRRFWGTLHIESMGDKRSPTFERHAYVGDIVEVVRQLKAAALARGVNLQQDTNGLLEAVYHRLTNLEGWLALIAQSCGVNGSQVAAVFSEETARKYQFPDAPA